MMKNKSLADKIRQLNGALYTEDKQPADLQKAITAISATIGSAVYVIDHEGVILAGDNGSVKLADRLKLMVKEQSFSADPWFMQLLKSSEPAYNEFHPDAQAEGDHRYSLIPVTPGDKKSAFLMICTSKKPLSDEQLTLAEVGALLTGLLLRVAEADQFEEEVRNRKLAEGAFESLSYSEVEAIQEILKNITNNESVVIASKIADSLGITRSVIVNALRKFESAGIIESRSLGMKGTFIRVKNLHALEMVASRSFNSGPYG